MDRVQAQCRKCGIEFSTAAMTRTTCPGCKAAVTVRRDRGEATFDGDERELPEGSAWVTGITALVGLAFVIFGIFKGRSSGPPQ